MKNIKILFLFLCLSFISTEMNAQANSNRISLGIGALYERGFDFTIGVEHETKHHNAWEYFANGYIKYAKDPRVGHITLNSATLL